MRISRLEIQAFGPFAGREVIDFDDLSSHGLFLLNGPTGAGKTSVLDAVCFALYGSVPGARQDGKRLRSDHADPATPPEVLCRFTASGRSFEVVRSPAWQRPSARAAKGTTPEQAKTLLRELVDGSWEAKSTRNDEAAQEITDLLGMNAKQFTRVVMLPQGQFAAFLRSDAKDRQDLLQQLFGTERFTSVERQLLDDAAVAGERLRDAESDIELIAGKAADEAAKHLDREDVSPGSEQSQLEGWLVGIEELVDNASQAAATARSRAETARTEHRKLTDRLERFRKLQVAREAETSLDKQAAAHADRRERQQWHRAAELLHTRIQAMRSATASLEECTAATQWQRQAVIDHPLTATAFTGNEPLSASDAIVENIEAAKAEIDARLAVLESQIPKERELQDKENRLSALGAQESELASAADQVSRQSTDLDENIAAVAARADEKRERAGTVDQAAAEKERTRAVVAAIAERNRLLQQDEELSGRHQRLRRQQLDAKERWLELLRSRLEHAAGEMARRLEEDSPCPVCGSTEHPQPSEVPEAVRDSDQQEEEARQQQEQADSRVQEADQDLQAVRQQLAVLASQGGDADPTAAEAEAAAAASTAAEAAEAARQQQELAGKLEALRAESTALNTRSQEISGELTQLRADAKSLQETVATLAEEIRAAKDGHETLQKRVAALQECSRLMGQYLEGMRKEDTARKHLDAVAADVDEAVAESVFDSVTAAGQALLSHQEAGALDSRIQDYEAEQHRVRAALCEESVVLAAQEQEAGVTAPGEAEVSRQGAAAEDTAATAEEAVVAHRMVQSSLEHLKRLHEELAAALETAGPVREHSRQLRELADLVRGTGENSYRMTLSTYVLAARLEQVAISATERLATMTSDRYSLVYDDSRAARNAKSGLGLQVVDEWTGQARDTSTLSGGESFMASLALALGLADVVQQESGGVDIETLFVDEGFGSLDEEALEQVMDALEGLRDGGRVVGLVSHVPEMKQRIPAQLQIVKGRNGSTVQVRQLEPVG
ncbi:AAA family ATPase [Arthrobacter castelli]|uniref:AAA family ATPase n=1 Tax=Arthrobacter castelli TaxID=271431 RepID=UPI000401D9B0|nr:SMC family ATPase [Arthrobacter castelli]